MHRIIAPLVFALSFCIDDAVAQQIAVQWTKGSHASTEINGIAWSRARDALYSCGSDGTVKGWSLPNNRLNWSRSFDTPALCLAHSELRDLVFVGLDRAADDQVVGLTSNGETALALDGPVGGIISIAISANGTTVAAVEDGGRLWVWDVDARQPRLPPVAIDDPRVVAITSTGDTAITGATDGTLSLWNTLTGSLIERHSCDAGVTAIAATDPREVFAGLVSGSLMRLSLQDGTLRRVAGPDVWERPTGPLTSIASTLQESRCLVGTSYGTVLIVDAQSGALAAVREGHVIDVYAIAIIDDGFVSAGRDGQLLRWRPAAVTPESIIELMAPVGASSFSSDGAAVVVNGWNQLTEFASATGRFGVGYAAGSGSELDIEHANASERIATAGSDGFIRVFDPGVATARSAQVDAIAMSVSFSHDDALLAFGGVNVVGWLHTADLTDRTDIDVVGHGYVTSFAPASDRLLIGDMTGMVRLIEVPSALELASLQVHGDQITALVPFGDRGWLSASLDGSVRLITSNPLRDTVVFAGSQPIYALAGHVDGFYFFGGGDSAVYGWMPDHPVNRVLELGGLILSLATSSSERRLAIGMNDALIMARVDGGSGVVEQRDLHDDAVVIRSTRGETTIRHREHACVSIYDMLGRLRMRALPDGDQQHVVRDLERGVYVCVVSERHDTRSALFHVDGP